MCRIRNINGIICVITNSFKNGDVLFAEIGMVDLAELLMFRPVGAGNPI